MGRRESLECFRPKSGRGSAFVAKAFNPTKTRERLNTVVMMKNDVEGRRERIWNVSG